MTDYTTPLSEADMMLSAVTAAKIILQDLQEISARSRAQDDTSREGVIATIRKACTWVQWAADHKDLSKSDDRADGLALVRRLDAAIDTLSRPLEAAPVDGGEAGDLQFQQNTTDPRLTGYRDVLFRGFVVGTVPSYATTMLREVVGRILSAHPAPAVEGREGVAITDDMRTAAHAAYAEGLRGADWTPGIGVERAVEAALALAHPAPASPAGTDPELEALLNENFGRTLVEANHRLRARAEAAEAKVEAVTKDLNESIDDGYELAKLLKAAEAQLSALTDKSGNAELIALKNGWEHDTQCWREVEAHLRHQASVAEASSASVTAERGAMRKAIRSFERADTELRRAEATADQPRLSTAGTRYYTAKIGIFRALSNEVSK